MPQLLGQIKKVDLRTIFSDESKVFTPWLAKQDNLRLLSDEIGVEIKLVQVEADVGRYNVDILAEEEGTGRVIIIENQLETTNHDHFGKIITYGAGHNAAIVIWIFRDIRDEHRKAVDWLNDHTDDKLAFFAIKVELWQIDNSNPAPKFEVIVSPNEWAKTIKASSTNKDLTDTKLQQLDFWTRFRTYIQERDYKMKLQTPRPQHWYDVSMGSSDAHIALTVNTRDQLTACELYINKNKDLFNYLMQQKEKIGDALGEQLDWVDAKVASKIKMVRKDFDISNQGKLRGHFDWLYNQTITFKKIFGKYIREFRRQ